MTLLGLSSFAQVSNNFLNKNPPRYELGAGALVLNTPDYPGADNNQMRFVPFPYFIYRGKVLRADDEGTRARFFSSPAHEIGLSFGLNFPVKASENPIRQGMPDLDTLMEIGPRLLLRLIAKNTNHRLNFAFAARAAYSSNFRSRFQSRGFSFEPSLAYWYRWRDSKTTLFSNLAFEFGSASLNQFFYSVQPTEATALRPSYLAKAGLIETALAFGAGQNITPRIFLFLGASWRNLDSSANRNSPLIVKRDNTALIAGIVWTFYESVERVEIL